MKILVVSPHPDDADISSGGTIARWTKEGAEVIYVVCTSGDKGSSDPEMTPERLASIREAEQREAARVLGVKEVVFLGHPDGELEDSREFRGELVKVIRRYRPQRLVAPDPYRPYHQHRDHRIGGQAALDAAYPYARDHLHYPEHRTLGLKPHKVEEAYLFGWGMENPDIYVDVTETFNLKLAALRCHRSQFDDRFPWLEERLRERSVSIGERAGVPLAEAFRIIQFFP